MMKNFRLFLMFLLLSFSSLVLAETAPDELVKTTADDVLAIVKKDKDIQAGDQKKIFALAEEKFCLILISITSRA